MRFAVLAVVLVGCGKSERPTDQATAKPVIVPDAAAPIASPTDAAVVAPTAARGSVEERRAIAKKIQAQGFVARTAGSNETILEVTSKSEGCKTENLLPVINASGQTMVNAGFEKMRCIGSGDFVDLVDGSGAPVADVGITAQKLLADYEENEISADVKYKGRTLRVTGRIERVVRDVLGDAFVHLEGRGLGLRANFADERVLTSLKKGQTIVLRCKGGGAPIVVTLDDCAIEPSGSKSKQP